jgi:hypothetical protein
MRNPEFVEATQWFKNGDHPLDGDDKTKEGKIVEQYPIHKNHKEDLCGTCKKPLWDHGVLYKGSKFFYPSVVCPGDYIVSNDTAKTPKYVVFKEKPFLETFKPLVPS